MPAPPAIGARAVALYIRWSTDEQTEGTTLETQRERCGLYVRSQGWEVSEDLIFVDDGYSGGSLDRPALTELRRLISAGVIGCVVVYSLDRLSRNLADIVQLVQNEWPGQCVLRSASQPIGTDQDSPTGQLIFNMLASFAEFERGLIRDRTYSGTLRRAREGKYPGGRTAPFGYQRTARGQITIDSMGPDGTLRGPAAAVRRMFELAVTGSLGLGPTRIARTLQAEGWPAPAGGHWWADTVRWMLRHPVYAGDVAFGRTRTNTAAQRNKHLPHRYKGQEPLVHVPNAAPAIIDRETWERAQVLGQRRQASYTTRNVQARNRSLLSSIARCQCGGPLSIFKKTKTGRRYYRCSRNFLTADGCGCEPGLLDAQEMEQAVVAAVKARYATAALRAAAVTQAQTAVASGQQQEKVRRAFAEIDRRLRDLETEFDRLRKAARRGEIQLSTYEELKADAEAEHKGLKKQRADLERQSTDTRAAAEAITAWQAHMAQLDLWDELDVPSQREILYGLLRQVVIYRRKGSDEAPVIKLVWEAPED